MNVALALVLKVNMGDLEHISQAPKAIAINCHDSFYTPRPFMKISTVVGLFLFFR
jgi:hypothetical protein